jgi:multidrug efflux pump subunit AcrB
LAFNINSRNSCTCITYWDLYVYAVLWNYVKSYNFYSRWFCTIGIVVDNAIVVIEAVHFKMDGLSPMKATKEAMHEVSGAIAITFVMAAVFIPALYVRSSWDILPTVFYNYDRNCAVWSCCIDTTPALCAMMLKNTWNT